jgi:SAM-dependent methyltransferase
MASESRQHDFICVLCEARNSVPVLRGCRDLYLQCDGEFDYVRCASCGVIQLDPVPPTMAEYYRSYPVHRRKSSVFSYVRSLCVRHAYYSVARAAAQPQTIVDFGCGDGWYAEHVAGQGHRVAAYETDPQHASTLSGRLGIQVFSELDNLLQEYSGRCDIVTMHFVVEHLRDPLEAFRIAKALLKPRGIWYFIIPNINSIEFRLFRRRWHGFDVPRHVSYLHPAAVESVAWKYALTVQSVKSVGSLTDCAGTVSNLLCGHYSPMCFLAALPVGLLWSMVVRQSCQAYTLRRV